MEGLRLRSLAAWWRPLLMFLLLRCPGFCSSLNDEGRELLRFRERVETDPFAALSDWVAGEGTEDPCDWFGIECEDDKVVVLNLKDLCLKGTLAPEIGKLSHLRSLVLHNNSFYGVIPKEFGVLQKLEALDLGYNNLSGPIPSDLGNIFSLKLLITRGNQFLGSMPSELYELSILSEFEVDGKLQSSNGRSTSRIGGNATIRRILQLNKTERNDQRQLGSVALGGSRTVHSPTPPGPPPQSSPKAPSPPPSSHHRPSDPQNGAFLSSKPPENPSSSPHINYTFVSPRTAGTDRNSSVHPQHRSRHNQTSSASSPSPPPPSNHNQTYAAEPPSNSTRSPKSLKHSSKRASQTKNMVMLVGVGLGIFSLVGLLIFCVLCYRCNKVVTVKPWATGLSGQLQKAFVTGVPQLKRSELETACEDFSNIIGSLSDCMLYKGTLSSGVEIAVASTLVTSSKDWSKNFESRFRKKIATLSKVNHKNFVNLLGYCEEEEPFTRMMVFEYAPNGTLFEHMHVREAEDLDWAARMRISMGIAYCLDHMHQLKSPVILGNLQSSSIYLTDDFAAKVSDFEFWSETTADESASGSSGPLDKQTLNPETIVYNFGILLLEIVTGRPPYSEDGGLLLGWASDYLNGSKPLRAMVDPSLKSFRDEDVNAIDEIIRRCCNPVPPARPTMKEVAGRLREVTAVPPDGASPRLSPLWWAELEILSTDAN